MPSAPTTSLDLADPALIADPYPSFAEERARHPVAWHEPSGTWLAFSHAAVSAVQRERRLGRIWHDREPASYLEPFNLLHRNQMMENEPPDHSRLRRPVARAFARGHVERLRPRVRELAAELLAEVDPEGFDVVEAYAEPLPVLVIAELLGVPAVHVHDLRIWSQAIVRMYEVDPGADVVDSAVRAAGDFAALVRELIANRRATPADDLISDLAATDLNEDEQVAAVVLLLNAGHEASVNVFGNGLVAMLQRRSGAGRRRRGDGRGDAALRLRAAAVRAHRNRRRASSATSPSPRARRSPCCWARPTATRRCSRRRTRCGSTARRTRTSRSGPACTSASGRRWPGWSWWSRSRRCSRRYPGLRLAGEPESRGTFVLRGYRSVRVEGS